MSQANEKHFGTERFKAQGDNQPLGEKPVVAEDETPDVEGHIRKITAASEPSERAKHF